MPVSQKRKTCFETDEQLVAAHRPLVYSVCGRYLRRADDIEDAAQETFLRLVRQRDRIHGSMMSWVSAAARSCSVDLIRRAIRERACAASISLRSRRRSAIKPSCAMRFVAASMRRLPLWANHPVLCLRRVFLASEPLAVIAEREDRSVSVISRRVASAIDELTAIFCDMGISTLNASALADFLGDAGAASYEAVGVDDLRFAPDWRAMEIADRCRNDRPRAFLPGWSRPVRIGALVSQASMTELGFPGRQIDPDLSLASCAWMHGDAFELVSIVEPGTSHIGQVERLVREHQLLGGMVSAMDLDGLKTLDVIHVGLNFALAPGAAQAIVQAVRGGVGFLSEGWTGGWKQQLEPAVWELLLSATPVQPIHIDPCGRSMLPATIRQASPLLPGLQVGDEIPVSGCGPVYRPAEGTRVLITKRLHSSVAQGGLVDHGSVEMPVYLTGQVGRGRVIAVNLIPRSFLLPRLSVSLPEYFANVIAWLAGPRREQSLL